MTIEERAIECCMTKFPLHDTADAKSMRSGYIYGANDQHKIDIDKACEWLKAVNGKRFNGFDIVYTQYFINEFRKAMEKNND